MRQEAYFCTVKELDELGKNNIPRQLISHTHLIYSSPATLAFNSPGAEGFGVKRAGLAVPDSIMLIVSPGCCGRNTSVLSSMRAYHDRFYYLLMDETDIVTGRHLKKIPKAVAEICEGLEKKPSVVMICITCVDALLGTDMERVCRKAEEYAQIPVKPCYMYALTREGRKPPMVHVRQSIYSLLEPKKKKGNVVNLLGYFSPIIDDCELYDLLHGAGVRYGFRVPEIYGTLSGENFIYVKQLAQISPETKVFSNLEPTMLYYDGTESGVNMTIGKDAGYYHKECPNVLWNEERQPFGYAGVRRLFEALMEV